MSTLEQLRGELTTARLTVVEIERKLKLREAMEPLIKVGFPEEEAAKLAKQAIFYWEGFKANFAQLTIPVSSYQNTLSRKEFAYTNGLIVLDEESKDLIFAEFTGRTFKDVRDYLEIANPKIKIAREILSQRNFNNKEKEI